MPRYFTARSIYIRYLLNYMIDISQLPHCDSLEGTCCVFLSPAVQGRIASWPGAQTPEPSSLGTNPLLRLQLCDLEPVPDFLHASSMVIVTALAS